MGTEKCQHMVDYFLLFYSNPSAYGLSCLLLPLRALPHHSSLFCLSSSQHAVADFYWLFPVSRIFSEVNQYQRVLALIILDKVQFLDQDVQWGLREGKRRRESLEMVPGGICSVFFQG
jgi:hypothetical protein